MGGPGSGAKRRRETTVSIDGKPPLSAPIGGPQNAEPIPPPDSEKAKAERNIALDGIEAEVRERQVDGTERTRRVRSHAKKPAEPNPEELKRKADAVATFTQFSNVALDILCERLPNPKPATEGEKAVMAQAVSGMVEKYFPMLGGYDVEIAFTLAVIMVIGPRLVVKKSKVPPPPKVAPIATPQGNANATPGDSDFWENGERKDAVDQAPLSNISTSGDI